MQFVASGLVVSVVLGAIAWSLVDWSTRGRCRTPLTRGPVERGIEYGVGMVCGPLIVFVIALAQGWPMQSQAVGMVGIVLATPLSATTAWTVGELLAGPTRRSWRPMIFSFLAGQAGLWVPLMMFSYFDRYVFHAKAGASAGLFISFVLGGFASAWAYRRWRSEIALNP
jgi:hypothetical protein